MGPLGCPSPLRTLACRRWLLTPPLTAISPWSTRGPWTSLKSRLRPSCWSASLLARSSACMWPSLAARVAALVSALCLPSFAPRAPLNLDLFAILPTCWVCQGYHRLTRPRFRQLTNSRISLSRCWHLPCANISFSALRTLATAGCGRCWPTTSALAGTLPLLRPSLTCIGFRSPCACGGAVAPRTHCSFALHRSWPRWLSSALVDHQHLPFKLRSSDGSWVFDSTAEAEYPAEFCHKFASFALAARRAPAGVAFAPFYNTPKGFSCSLGAGVRTRHHNKARSW